MIGVVSPWSRLGGGTEIAAEKLARGLSEIGMSVVAIFFEENSDQEIKVSENLTFLLSKNSLQLGLDQALKQAKDNHGVNLIIGLHLNRRMLDYVKSGQKHGLKVIISEHINPIFPIGLGVQSDNEREKAIAESHGFHVLSKKYMPALRDEMTSKVFTIPNWVENDPVRLPQKSSPFRGETIVMASRLTPRKNVELAIRAFSLMNRVLHGRRLLILGEGPERNNLETLSWSLGCENQISFLGHKKNIGETLSQADLFLHTAQIEGWPLATLEAMHVGLPILGFSNCDGLSDQVEHDSNGVLVDPYSGITVLVDALITMLTNPHTLSSMGENSRKKARTFSKEGAIESWRYQISRLVP